MSKKEEHRKKLFISHVTDLQNVCPKAASVFVCPICFNVLTEDGLSNGDLTNGHVWSKAFVREYSTSERAKHQQVLLCNDCNSRSGDSGEGTLVRFEAFRRTREAGQFYRPSTRVFPSRGVHEPAELGSISVEFKKDRQGLNLRFPVHKKTGQPLYNPREKQKSKEYFTRGPCTVIVEETYPFKDKWQYAQVALLTSAYLLAFYSFGYRYILHSYLDPVREYIRNSFTRNVDSRLDFQETKTIAVRVCGQHFNEDPEIDFFPVHTKSPHYLEISFLDYHIRLPYTHPLIIPEELLSLHQDIRAITIRASEHKVHPGMCNIDSFIGEPDYCVEGDKLFLRDLVMVGGAVARHTANSEPCVRLPPQTPAH